MKLRMLAACLAAGATASSATAGILATTGNPKTAQRPYSTPASVRVPSSGSQAAGIGAGNLGSPPRSALTLTAPSNDECTSPIAIVGLNTSYDLTGATTNLADGQNEPLCNIAGFIGIDSDIWFTWVAPSDGQANLSGCVGMAALDTKIAVYLGSGCPSSGSALACDDDSCPFPGSSSVAWACTGGLTYLIQVGLFPGASPGAGSFSIGVLPWTSVACEPGLNAATCPCGNPPTGSGKGCNNKDNTGGAVLSSAGDPSLSTPTLVLTSTNQNMVGSQLSILMQSKTQTSGVFFGHGIRCVGPFKRLYTWLSGTSPFGTSFFPPPGALSIPDRCAFPTSSGGVNEPIFAGQVRYYQVYYRDNIGMIGNPLCPLLTSRQNSTNSVSVTWH